MKILFVIILALSSPIVYAQNCNVKKEIDLFTRDTKLSIALVQLNLTALTIDANKKEFDFFFMLDGTDKCFDDNATVLILFEGNKQRNNFHNVGSINCEGLFHFTIRNGRETPYMIKRLSTQKMFQIIFTGNNDKKTIITLTPTQQEILMNAVGCIATEAKLLYQ